MHYKLSPLILTPGQASGFISEVYITQPDSRKESAAGRVFIIIEVESKSPEDLKIVNFIIENFCDNYYHNDKIYLREKSKTVKIEHIFESALATTNKKLLDFLHQEKIKFNPTAINATIGVIFENNIHFACVGSNKALLVYHDKKDNLYKIADVIEHAKDSKENKNHINIAKLFSSVISGKIPKNGYFIFSNEAIPEFMSNSQLIKIITTLPPISASEQIKKTLNNINNYIPFLGLIIKNTVGIPAENTSINEYNKENNVSSKDIRVVEESTEDILTSKSVINISNWNNKIKNSIASFLNIFSGNSSNSPKLLQLKDRIFFKRRSTQFSFKKINDTIKDIASLLVQASKLIVKSIQKLTSKEKSQTGTISSKINIRTITKSLGSKKRPERNSANPLNKFPNIIRNANKQAIVIFTIIIACLSLLFINTSNINEEKKEITNTTNNTELIDKITQKQNQIEANLLYNNENNAKNILNEVSKLIEELPKDALKYEALLQQHNSQLDKIRHAKEIDSAKQIADFSTLNAKADPINIILADSVIYVGDSRQKTIYTLDLKNNLSTAVLNTDESITALKYPIKNSNTSDIYYINDEKSLVKLSPNTDTISTLPISFKDINFDSIKGGANFGSYIYYISRSDNQIYKFRPTNKGFPNHTSWLKEKDLDVSNAIDMEIDGHIYVLKANGEILKLLRGESQEFNLDKVEPEIKMATKFLVSPEEDYIYILDPLQKRLIVFSKDGNFIVQYTSNNFNNLKDFVVDEKNKILYFLDKSAIYKISATHL